LQFSSQGLTATAAESGQTKFPPMGSKSCIGCVIAAFMADSLHVHAQGMISAACFFRGNFFATPCQLMLLNGSAAANASREKRARAPRQIRAKRIALFAARLRRAS
jgi:hypothetical protein